MLVPFGVVCLIFDSAVNSGGTVPKAEIVVVKTTGSNGPCGENGRSTDSHVKRVVKRGITVLLKKIAYKLKKLLTCF